MNSHRSQTLKPNHFWPIVFTLFPSAPNSIDGLTYLEPQGILSSMAVSTRTARETNPHFMNGVPELLILRLLHQEEMYGYEIVQSIHSGTDAVIAVGEGVVY